MRLFIDIASYRYASATEYAYWKSVLKVDKGTHIFLFFIPNISILLLPHDQGPPYAVQAQTRVARLRKKELCVPSSPFREFRLKNVTF